MKLNDLLNEDGKIVKGVNTTVDVGVNQIPIETAKFGSKVDKYGRPPTMSSTVKGKSTNVLFNLGLAESIETKTRRNYNEFVQYCCDFLELEQKPTIRLTDEIFDETFGFFNSEDNSITVSYNRRHQMDVMRTIAHELTHYRQRLDGEELNGEDGSDHENEANAFAGVMLRQWADKNPHLFKEQKFTDYELALIEGGHTLEETVVKPKKPGRLFAALTEGYKLQLERDTDVLVLHIKDNDTGKRTEVRGKPGYETKGYDPDDTLHQLLDIIGKSANISELMNGEVVTINPKHPDAKRALAATDRAYNESLDNPYPIRWSIKNNNEWYGHAKEDDFYNQIGIEIKDRRDNGFWSIRFKVGEKMDKTGEGDQFRIFATVQAAIKEWWNWAIKNAEVNQITFSAEKILDSSRSKLYNRFAKQFARAIGYNFEVVSGRASDIFYLKKPGLEENFADGKVKGKSRPGRVKKAGASCNGSVTDLRKRAKNSSGEKAKMYHWCANMKSGRKK